jgi:hypothetical protein
MSKPIIVLEPQGGLCNRMRAIVGALDLAKTLDARLIVTWVRTGSLNASFSDVFQDIPVTLWSLQRKFPPYRIGRAVFVNWIPHLYVDDDFIRARGGNERESWTTVLRGRNILLRTCGNITGGEDFGIFKLQPALRERNPFRSMKPNTVGVHIRRTDNTISKDNSPTDCFVRAMRRELERDPSVGFYLATDEPREEEMLVQEFGDRIMTYRKRSLDRNSRVGIEDASIDLFNLAACTKIFGSHWSSFSDVAAQLGSIEKIVIKKPDC